MLKEFFITPQTFSSNNIKLYYPYLKNLLETIESSGYMLDLNNGEWAKETRKIINNYQEQKIKDNLNNIYNFLKDRHRIVSHPKVDLQPKNESDWLSIAQELNKVRRINNILATKLIDNNNNIISLEELENININERFGITGSKEL